MLHFRKYGQSPYKVVVVHGGPGAAGEMALVASQLAFFRGVIEPLQTAMTIEAQVEELRATIMEQTEYPVVLIGFSWGAWLSILLTSQYKHLVSKIVIVGCGPLENEFSALVYETRMNRLNRADRHRFATILSAMEEGKISNTGEAFLELGKHLSAADSYHPVAMAEEALSFNVDIYKSIWNEAVELRKSGRLLMYAKEISCPVISIHGDYDPHPALGVIEPLDKNHRDFRWHILKKCGHKPWIEKYARKEFFNILSASISE